MQRRLIACGARPINNVVDITNYVLLECGQPLHTFDFERLAEGMIVVRRARAGERITTLDGETRTLSAEMLVIADAAQAIAVAGVMGGAESEVTRETRTILLESALFDPVAVRRTARTLGLSSESSYRFERGVDPAGVEAASARAGALITELAEGEEAGVVEAGAKPLKRTGIVVEAERISRWLGMELSPTAIRTSLARLSCQVATVGTGSTLHVGVPSFRADLTQDVDLAEELARLSGYDRVPTAIPRLPIAGAALSGPSPHEQVQALKRLCASLGLCEIITWALIPEADAAGAVRLSNPLSQEQAVLRPHLAAGMLRVVARNLAQGAEGVRVFELGGCFEPADAPAGPFPPAPGGATGPREVARLGLAIAGTWQRDWQGRWEADLVLLKGLVEGLVGRRCRRPVEAERAASDWMERGEQMALRVDGTALGCAGRIGLRACEAFGIDAPVWYAELSVDTLLRHGASATARASPPPAFPPVKRDLSVVVMDATPFAAVRDAIREVGGALASRIELIDRYTGAQTPPGTHSLTFSIAYRHAERTLTSEEVEVLHRRIGEALVSRLGAQLR